MSDEAQVEDNIRIASNSHANSLTDEELVVFDNVKRILHERTKIPCTACGYCMPCPAGVDIPGCFSHYNDKYLIKDKGIRFQYYRNLGAVAAQPSYASQCKDCGKCESHCPQKISIRSELKTVSKEMESILYKAGIAIARKVMKIK